MLYVSCLMSHKLTLNVFERRLCVACFVPDEPSHTLMSLRRLCVVCFVPNEP